MFCLTFGRQSKSFLGPFVGFLFGHEVPFRLKIISRKPRIRTASTPTLRNEPGSAIEDSRHTQTGEFAILWLECKLRKRNSAKKTKMCAKQQPLRIVYLTAGAGGMYCGSCLRDNTLVRFLRRIGTDAQLIPFYTPLRTDESDLSENQLFFGGIRLYLTTKSRFFRRIPRRFTGWMDHRWLVNKVASRHLETDPSQLGQLTLDMLAGHQGPLKSEVNRLCQWLESQRPDLINLSNLLIAGCVSELKRRLNVPVLVTLQGDDLFLDQLPEEFRTQVIQQLRNIAGLVDGFIVNSRFYGQKMGIAA